MWWVDICRGEVAPEVMAMVAMVLVHTLRAGFAPLLKRVRTKSGKSEWHA